jgi:hypothetical protein
MRKSGSNYRANRRNANRRFKKGGMFIDTRETVRDVDGEVIGPEKDPVTFGQACKVALVGTPSDPKLDSLAGNKEKSFDATDLAQRIRTSEKSKDGDGIFELDATEAKLILDAGISRVNTQVYGALHRVLDKHKWQERVVAKMTADAKPKEAVV